jgi:hypothetical protein
MIGFDNSDVILLRFPKAGIWNIQLIDTIQWKINTNMEKILSNGENHIHIEYEQIRSGKTFFASSEKFPRPANCLSDKDHIREQFPSETTEKRTIFSMEIRRKLSKYPNGTILIIFDIS